MSTASYQTDLDSRSKILSSSSNLTDTVVGLISTGTTTNQMELLLTLPQTQNSTIQKTNTMIALIVMVMKRISFKNSSEDPANTTLTNKMRLKVFIIRKLQLISKP